MLRQECRQKVLAKLTTARSELEDALTISAPAARYDPTVLSDTARDRVTSIINELNGLVRVLEGIQ